MQVAANFKTRTKTLQAMWEERHPNESLARASQSQVEALLRERFSSGDSDDELEFDRCLQTWRNRYAVSSAVSVFVFGIRRCSFCTVAEHSAVPVCAR